MKPRTTLPGRLLLWAEEFDGFAAELLAHGAPDNDAGVQTARSKAADLREAVERLEPTRAA